MLTEVLTITDSAATPVAYSRNGTIRHQLAGCQVQTAGVSVFIVEADDTDTSEGAGPYCDVCSGGSVIPALGAAYLRTSAGTASVACTFVESWPSGSSFGGSSAGLSRAAADARYLVQGDAASTYLTIADAASTYLTEASAATSFLPLSGGTLTGSVTLSSGGLNVANGGIQSSAGSVVSSRNWDGATSFQVQNTTSGTSAHAVVNWNNGSLFQIGIYSPSYSVGGAYYAGKIAFTNHNVGGGFYFRDATNAGYDFHVQSGGFTGSSHSKLRIGPTEVVVNEPGVTTVDFRAEGTSEPNLLMVDASAAMVGVGKVPTAATLDVDGSLAAGGGVVVDAGGFLRVKSFGAGPPSTTDCDAVAETGRLYLDQSAPGLFVCNGTSGWLMAAL